MRTLLSIVKYFPQQYFWWQHILLLHIVLRVIQSYLLKLWVNFNMLLFYTSSWILLFYIASEPFLCIHFKTLNGWLEILWSFSILWIYGLFSQILCNTFRCKQSTHCSESLKTFHNIYLLLQRSHFQCFSCTVPKIYPHINYR